MVGERQAMTSRGQNPIALQFGGCEVSSLISIKNVRPRPGLDRSVYAGSPARPLNARNYESLRFRTGTAGISLRFDVSIRGDGRNRILVTLRQRNGMWVPAKIGMANGEKFFTSLANRLSRSAGTPRARHPIPVRNRTFSRNRICPAPCLLIVSPR